VLLWFTKTDNYMFNLDAVRVPQKYPGKRYFKGPKVGELSGNPLGKNPSDVWIFPNVKNNHVEKTDHPCQYPIELVDRMVLSTTRPGDIVMDPFAGASTTLVAALLRGRRALGAEIVPEYQEISEERIAKTLAGKLRVRPTGTPVYQPTNDTIARLPLEFATARQQYASSAHL
jgi:adenine-specific DNA-methyltransferase